ncbi:MAG TPA: hypothetical protein VFG14_01380 [Chthoniobacteraceae bacterium]|nr:hypothetical protein [Chthoniobacteraceae bacterium]
MLLSLTVPLPGIEELHVVATSFQRFSYFVKQNSRGCRIGRKILI